MPTIGDNIARLRRTRGVTQEQLAEAAALSVDTVSKLERNERTAARMETLGRLARALGVSTTALLGDASTAAARREPHHRALSLMDLRRALTPARGISPDDPPQAGAGTPMPLAAIQAKIREADRAYQRNDYATVLAILPGLLDATRAAAVATPAAEHRRAHVLLAQAYCVTGELLIQLRAGDLAYCALTAGLDAARAADDRIIGAFITRAMTWLLVRQARFGEAERLAVAAADAIEPRVSRAGPEELAAWGWLLVGAAGSAARDNRPDDAVALLDAAAAAAASIGDRRPVDGHLTIVGGLRPARIQTMRVETAAVTGDPARALLLSEQVRPDQLPMASSWWRHRLDVAWAYAETSRWGEATEVLTDIRAQAPVWLRHQRYARDIVSKVATGRRRAMGRELAELAALVGADL